jgi:hypothetical protein
MIMREHKIIESDPLYLNETEGQIDLWRAVIKQALDDVRLPLTNQRYRRWNKQAMKWFDEENEDFIEVCHRANLSTTHILKIVKDIISVV